MKKSNYGRKKEITVPITAESTGSLEINIDYETIFRDSVDAFIIISLVDGKVVKANGGALKLLKYNEAEMFKLAAKDIFSLSEYSRLRLKYLKEDHAFDGTFIESVFLLKDGRKIPVTVSIKEIGEKMILLIARDISAAKQTEEALRREAFIFENLNDAVMITDLDGYIQSWNSAAEKVFGYKREEAIDNFINILFRQPEFAKQFGKIRSKIQRSLLWSGEADIVRKNGNEGIAETSVFPFRDSSGEHIAYVVILKDITQRKQTERTMRERDLMYRSLIESSADAVYILKGKKLLLVNSAWCKVFGYSKEEALSDDFDIMKIVAPEHKEFILNRFNKSTDQRPDSSSYELKAITKDKRIIDLEVKVNKILWNDEVVYQGIYRDITEKKIAETALKESEEKFRKLVEKSLVGVYIIQDGVFRYVNPRLARIFGYSVEEILNKKMGPSDFTHPDDMEVVNRNVASRLSGKIDSIAYSFEGIKKDGTPLFLEVFGTRAILSDKPAVIGTLLDITKNKKAEEALKESEEKYKTIIESASDAIVIVDIGNRTIIEVNKQAEKLTGRSREELIGKSHLILHPAEYREIYSSEFTEVVLGNQRISQDEVLIQHRDGTVIPVEISTSQSTMGSKAVLQGIFRDLRERKKVEEQIRKLSRAVEQSPSAIVITNLKGNIEYVNPHFCKVTGYSQEEAFGRNPNMLKSGSTSAAEYKNMWETITAGNEWRGEFHNKKKNGELYWEQASISPIRDDKGNITHYIAIKEDITEKKKMQQELLIAKEKAEESDRMKSEFLSQMSHEIRTPLNVILSYNSFLQEELSGKINEDIRLSFNSIDSAGKRLLRTIDMILNLAAVQKGNVDISFDPVDLGDILKRLSREFEFQAREKKLYLRLKMSSENVIIKGDDYLLSGIFQNLLNNALKYTNTGGIEVETTVLEDNKVKVDIHDTGIGISKTYLPRLFLPFTQEESGYTRKFEGNGLGLALVKSYLDLLNAEINVFSEKGKGTTFSIIFNH